MAVTFAVTDLFRDVGSTQNVRKGLITLTGTTTDDGDTIAASAFGLSRLDSLEIETLLDSTANPENAFVATWNKTSGKIVLHTAHGTPGGAVPLLQVTDGTTVTGYSARFRAEGV